MKKIKISNKLISEACKKSLSRLMREFIEEQYDGFTYSQILNVIYQGFENPQSLGEFSFEYSQSEGYTGNKIWNVTIDQLNDRLFVGDSDGELSIFLPVNFEISAWFMDEGDGYETPSYYGWDGEVTAVHLYKDFTIETSNGEFKLTLTQEDHKRIQDLIWKKFNFTPSSELCEEAYS